MWVRTRLYQAVQHHGEDRLLTGDHQAVDLGLYGPLYISGLPATIIGR